MNDMKDEEFKEGLMGINMLISFLILMLIVMSIYVVFF